MRQRKRRTIPLRKSQTNYVSGTSFTTKPEFQKARSKRWMSAVAKVRFEKMCRQKITQCPFGQRVFEYWQNILAVYRVQNFCNRMRIFVTQRLFCTYRCKCRKGNLPQLPVWEYISQILTHYAYNQIGSEK